MQSPSSSALDFRPGRHRFPPGFQLWPDAVPLPPFAVQEVIHYPEVLPREPALLTPTFPVTPPIPPAVITGDLITAVHENTVTTGISNLWTDLQWLAANTAANPTTTKGDLIVNDGVGLDRLPAGADAQVLTADLSQSLGLKWTAPASQTPWTSDINAVGFKLNKVAGLGIGNNTFAAAGFGIYIDSAAYFDSVKQTNPNSNGWAGFSLQNDAGNTFAFRIYGSARVAANMAMLESNSHMAFSTSANERMRITATGNVGIAKTNPAYALDVTGDINSTGAFRVNGAPLINAAQTPWLQAINGGGFNLTNVGKINISLISPGATPLYVATQFNSDPSLVHGALCTAEFAISSGSPSALAITHQIGAPYTVSLQTRHYSVDAQAYPLALNPLGGAVGVGTVTPGYKLDVTGDINCTGAFRVNGAVLSQTPWTSNINAAGFNLNGVGAVGIGTSGPLAPLHVAAADGFLARINGPTAGFFIYSVGADYQIGTSGAGALQFDTQLTERMRIDAAGKVGIGTASPDSRLTVTNNPIALPAPPAGTILHLGGADAENPRITMDAFGGIANWTLRSAGGTAGAPTASIAGAVLGNIVVFGRGATGYSAGARAAIGVVAAENWTDAAQGTIITFATTLLGAAGTGERMRIDGAGNVGIAKVNPAYALDVTGDVNCTGVYRQNGVALTALVWTALSLSGTWHANSATFYTPAAALSPNGICTLSGGISHSAFVNGSTVFTLPSASMYPAKQVQCTVLASDPAVGSFLALLVIAPTGSAVMFCSVTPGNACNFWVDNVSYRVA